MPDSEAPISSNRPYLLRAIYEWILDNNLTPQILVDATQQNVKVPNQHVKDGQILLNVGTEAVNNLVMDNHSVSFSARFSGRPMAITVPISAVLAVFSRENGQGMAFPDEAEMEQALIDEISEKPETKVADASMENFDIGSDIDVEVDLDKPQEKPKRSKPSLKIVK
jgi:stringent starvation protein B